LLLILLGQKIILILRKQLLWKTINMLSYISTINIIFPFLTNLASILFAMSYAKCKNGTYTPCLFDFARENDLHDSKLYNQIQNIQLIIYMLTNDITLSKYIFKQLRYIICCAQCLSLLTLWVRIPLGRGVLDTTLCDKVCQWLVSGLYFSPGTHVSSNNKTDHQDITVILLKVALNTITITNDIYKRCFNSELGNSPITLPTMVHGQSFCRGRDLML